MEWLTDPSFWVMCVKRVSGAGKLGVLVSIVIYGSSVLEDYDTFNCVIGGNSGDDVDVDPHSYKIATQLIFISSIVSSISFSPQKFKERRVMFAVASMIAMGLIVSIFMAGYAAITTNCSTSEIVNGTLNRLRHNHSEPLADLNPVFELMETTGSMSMAISFLAFSIILTIMSHDIFSKDAQMYVALTHWPVLLDGAMRLVSFAMIAHMLDKDGTYTDTNDINSAECILVLDGLKNDGYGKAVPYKHTHMSNLALSIAVLTGVELLARSAEYWMKKYDIKNRAFTMTVIYNRFLTMLSRFCVGIFVFGFIMANELLVCQPFHIDGYFKTMIGFLLASYFTSVLNVVLIDHGNSLLMVEAGIEHAMELAADNFDKNTDMSTSGYLNPLIS